MQECGFAPAATAASRCAICSFVAPTDGAVVSATNQSLHVRFACGEPGENWKLIYCFTMAFPTAGYHQAAGCFTLPMVAGPRLALWLLKHFGPQAASWEVCEVHPCCVL